MTRLPVGHFHAQDCIVEYAQNKRDSFKKKNLAKDTREKKQRLKTRSEWIKDAQKAVNEYVRLRDEKETCISCGCSSNERANFWDAGHYRSRGATPELRFNTLNIYKQCKRCNRELSGNVVEMRSGIISRYGYELVGRIEGKHKPLKADIAYLQRLTTLMRKKVRLYRRLRNEVAP